MINSDNYQTNMTMIQTRNEQGTVRNKNMEPESDQSWIMTYMELDRGNTGDMIKTEWNTETMRHEETAATNKS